MSSATATVAGNANAVEIAALSSDVSETDDNVRGWCSIRARRKMDEVPLGGKMHSSSLSLHRTHGGPPEWMHWEDQHEIIKPHYMVNNNERF